MQEIKLDPQEVKELLAIVDKHNGHFIDDLRQAEMIQTIAKRGELCTTSDNVFRNSYNLMGAIFRIAYIAGQRSVRRGNKRRKKSPPEPLITEPVRREDIGALYTAYHSDLPHGGGVTLQDMEKLFGKKIGRGAVRYITGFKCGWHKYTACKQTVIYLEQPAFNTAVLGYCNHYLERGKHLKSKNDKGTKKRFTFLYRATAAAQGKPWGTAATFECPVCGGIATVTRDRLNGHYFAHCPTCKTRLIE